MDGACFQKQGLAEAPRAGQKIVLALGDQAQLKAGLVHTVEVALADFTEALDTNGQGAPSHGEWASRGDGIDTDDSSRVSRP
jgi:hypothetical protein